MGRGDIFIIYNNITITIIIPSKIGVIPPSQFVWIKSLDRLC
jgi:hypothetical protein